ncbi:2TM domain-containing protein [Flagellimonas aequoris]|uniref:Histidine kinase n=1 Tax=Flagellimonas aequoris TaxID=2306997 RepID=A0A418N3B3_9FLAO|nr:2TM domain-containing protein [Allomuricauda aequoris]RIV68335.1 histidine kinase [Allomuricauda aequoris]TXK00025.1 histidine kinase [Allomuricauda aequoris]
MKLFLKELIKSFLVGIAIFLVVLIILFLNGWDFTMQELWTEFWESMIFSMIIYLCNSASFILLMRKYDKELFTRKYIAYGILGNIIASIIGIFLSRVVLKVIMYNMSFEAFFTSERPQYYVNTFFISMVVALLFYAAYFYKYYKEKQVKEQKIIAGSASARFDALKNQLDPHFLFNSLNVLTSLIEEDPDQAQKFTTSLSKVYRYVLEQKNKDLVTVDEELNFARTYVRLLKMRFEDSIIFDIPEKCTQPDAKIVPLSLQLLLENAVKHNVVTSSKPLHIKVFEQGGMLVVSNNLQEKQVVKKSSGVGLQNIRQRYQILTDRGVIINKTNSDFSVSLPMLTQRYSVVETQQSYIEEKRYAKAKERVKAIRDFYGNLISYCIVIPFLWWINLRTTDFLWAFFPTIGWGFGVLAHGMEAFGYNPLWGKRWQERKIRELMEKDDF